MTTVSDLQVAAVRAFLIDDREERRRLHEQMDSDAEQAGYSGLIAGSCIEAIDRRFGRDSNDAQVVEWVDKVSERSDETSDDLDVAVTERIIKTVLGRDSIGDLEDDTVVRYQMMITAAFVAEEQFDAEQLDEFLSKARMIADHLLNA